jgi:hypothetical protein
MDRVSQKYKLNYILFDGYLEIEKRSPKIVPSTQATEWLQVLLSTETSYYINTNSRALTRDAMTLIE